MTNIVSYARFVQYLKIQMTLYIYEDLEFQNIQQVFLVIYYFLNKQLYTKS